MLRLEDLPGRVFLDTCVVNFILDYGGEIHENEAAPDNTDDRTLRDIQALRNVFFVGERSHWQLAISPHTWQEVNQTRNPHRRHNLESWFHDIWQHWCDVVHQDDDLPTFIEAERLRVGLLSSGNLGAFPDLADRVLICDAVAYRCELFCTRDWSTVLRHRESVEHLPLDIVSPVEWWARIEPYARLFV
jgi:hypothetical protein